MNKNPVMWVASNYTLQINRRKVTSYDLKYPRATFHDTWEEAHAASLALAQQRLERAGLDAKRAVSAALSAAKLVSKIESMTKPSEAA